LNVLFLGAGNSAGSIMAEAPPRTLEILKRNAFRPEDFRSTGREEFSGPDAPAHWGVRDTAAASGSEAEIALAFADIYLLLNNRVSLFASLPLASLDRLSLQRRLDDIGQTSGQPTPAH
jgi:hypothetical protein